ncbi:MAG: hypothetical protein HUJ61_00655 [Bacilli bacterium]|nr:hypothetical protein [Bacilli bacterium]
MHDEIAKNSIENVEQFPAKMSKHIKHNRNSFIVRLITSFVIICSVFGYPFLPSATLRGMKLKGGYNLDTEYVLNLTTINKHTPNIFLNTTQLVNEIEQSPLIESAEVEWKPFCLNLIIDEVVALLKYNEETYLSNGMTVNEIKSSNPSFIWDWEDSKVPTFLSTLFDRFQPDRKKAFMNNLKKIEKKVLFKSSFIDLRSDGTSYSVSEGFVLFYFPVENESYYIRLAVSEEHLAFFLNEEYLDIIFNQVNKIGNNAKIYQDIVNDEIYYKSVTCYYGDVVRSDGITYHNPVIIDTL